MRLSRERKTLKEGGWVGEAGGQEGERRGGCGAGCCLNLNREPECSVNPSALQTGRLPLLRAGVRNEYALPTRTHQKLPLRHQFLGALDMAVEK